MDYKVEVQKQKYFIGLELRTNNDECSTAMPIHKDRFFREDTVSKIPNKVGGDILALYTDYEGDFSKPYSWILGCEVSSLDEVPDGLVGKVIPESKYAVYTTEGEFPQGLIAAWTSVWTTPLPRLYTCDFEIYPSDFDPVRNPKVKLCIAIKDASLEAVLQGRYDAFRSYSVNSPLPNADFQETEEKCVYSWGIDYAVGNGVIEKTPDRKLSDQEIEQTILHFSSHNLPFIWWSSDKVLEEKGFQFGGILTGISLDLSQGIPPQPASLPGLKVQVVESKPILKAFAELSADVYAMNPKAAKEWFALNEGAMKGQEQIHFVACLEDEVVGTATLSVSPDSAGIWNLATSPDHRKQGVGAALVQAALLEAKKRDHDKVMAILMPKGMAWGLFTKLGFKEVCEFPFYVYGVSAEELEK